MFSLSWPNPGPGPTLLVGILFLSRTSFSQKKAPQGAQEKIYAETTIGLDSDEGADCVVDVVVGDITGVAGNAMVGLDVIQGFDVPGGGQFEGAVDFIETSDEVLIHRAGATSHQAVGDLTEVVTDITGTLCFAAGVGGVVAPLHLGGVGELAVHSLGSTVYQRISFGVE